MSTALILHAASLEPEYRPQIVCVEPYPTQNLRKLAAEGRISLVPEMAQNVDLDVLTSAGADGMLFIDSTHTIRIGSEVTRLITEVMPRLPSGCAVHFHDIYFPYDYQPDVLGNDVFFGRETTLLYAYLANNTHCRIDMSLSMLHDGRQKSMQELIGAYQPRPLVDGIGEGTSGHFPSACYLRIT